MCLQHHHIGSLDRNTKTQRKQIVEGVLCKCKICKRRLDSFWVRVKQWGWIYSLAIWSCLIPIFASHLRIVDTNFGHNIIIVFIFEISHMNIWWKLRLLICLSLHDYFQWLCCLCLNNDAIFDGPYLFNWELHGYNKLLPACCDNFQTCRAFFEDATHV